LFGNFEQIADKVQEFATAGGVQSSPNREVMFGRGSRRLLHRPRYSGFGPSESIAGARFSISSASAAAATTNRCQFAFRPSNQATLSSAVGKQATQERHDRRWYSAGAVFPKIAFQHFRCHLQIMNCVAGGQAFGIAQQVEYFQIGSCLDKE